MGRSINDAQRALLTSMDWYRDGKAIYRGLDTVARDDGVRPNSGPYRYKLCIKNAVDEQCSDEVSASPTPAPPSVPLDVKATRWPGMKGLMLDWFINDVPGVFFTAERQNANQKHWTELQRWAPFPADRCRLTREGCPAADPAPPPANPALLYGPDTCKQGYVWREAFNGDTVCVTSERRAQVRADNAQVGARRAPNGGPYGPDTCKQCWVWRDARSSDHVCVTPAERTLVAAENASANERRVVPR